MHFFPQDRAAPGRGLNGQANARKCSGHCAGGSGGDFGQATQGAAQQPHGGRGRLRGQPGGGQVQRKAGQKKAGQKQRPQGSGQPHADGAQHRQQGTTGHHGLQNTADQGRVGLHPLRKALDQRVDGFEQLQNGLLERLARDGHGVEHAVFLHLQLRTQG